MRPAGLPQLLVLQDGSRGAAVHGAQVDLPGQHLYTFGSDMQQRVARSGRPALEEDLVQLLLGQFHQFARKQQIFEAGDSDLVLKWLSLLPYVEVHCRVRLAPRARINNKYYLCSLDRPMKALLCKRNIIITSMLNNTLPFEWPLLVCAPMVDQSELPFRMLTRKYGANLCYTPMLHSRMMTTQKKYKAEHFTTCPGDRPLVAQICGNDPETMVKAAKMLEDEVDAIDVNFGCPQAIAKRGHYGSYLLEEPDTVYNVIKALAENVKVPIFCKIRIRKTEEKTFEVVDKIISAGCSLLTVHGRTKEQNKQRVGYCDWKMIKKIKDYVSIPVIANGGIFSYKDVQDCLKQTGVDGVMSAQALLENPALFSNKVYCLDELALEYLDLTQQYPGASISCIRAHLFKILHKGLSQNIDLREKLSQVHTFEEFKGVALALRERRQGTKLEDKFGWYQRYWDRCYVKPGDAMEFGPIKQGTEQPKQQENKQQIEKVGDALKDSSAPLLNDPTN